MSTAATTQERDELRGVARAFLADRTPMADVRARMTSAHPPLPEAWGDLARLGLVDLLVPEELGGPGGAFADAAVVLEECGRALTPLPCLGTTVAYGALLAAGTDDGRRIAGELCGTGDVATVALGQAGRAWRPLQPGVVAEPAGDGYRLTGTKHHVVDARHASLLVVSAVLRGAAELFVVRPGPDAVLLEQPTLDLTRPLAELHLRSAPATLVSDPDRPGSGVAGAVDVLHAALALEGVGGARRCLEMTVQHLRDRVQFGRPIGSFQALQHRCADLAISIDAAASTASYAAQVHGTDEFAVVAPMAGAVCAETFTRVAAEAIQLHGGIGFTWEHDAHLFFKRAKSGELLHGSPRELRRVVGSRAGLVPGRVD